MNINKKQIIISTIVIGLLSGCGSSSSSGTNTEDINIKGTIVSSSNQNGKSRAISDIGDISEILKMVVISNKGENQNIYDVTSSGSFDIPTSDFSSDDLTIFAVNKDTKEVYGNLGLTNGTNRLDSFDKSKLTNTLDFGNIYSGTMTSNISLSNANVFSAEDLSILEKVAIGDDSIVLYQNKYKSPNYEVQMHNHYDIGTLSEIEDTFSNPNDFNTTQFRGSQPVVITSTSIWDNIGQNDILFYPPSDVSYTTNFASGDFNNTSNSTTILPCNYYMASYGGDETRNFYSFEYIKSYPLNDWILKINGNNTQQAKFVFANANPFDNNDNLKVPIPSVKINMNGNFIGTIEVKWFIYDGTQYIELSEAMMKQIAFIDANRPYITISNGSTGISRAESDNWIGTYTITQGDNIDIDENNTDSDISKANKINIPYNIGQVSYQFMFSEK